MFFYLESYIHVSLFDQAKYMEVYRELAQSIKCVGVHSKLHLSICIDVWPPERVAECINLGEGSLKDDFLSMEGDIDEARYDAVKALIHTDEVDADMVVLDLTEDEGAAVAHGATGGAGGEGVSAYCVVRR